MNINIQEPRGLRQAVTPFDGIEDERALIKSLIMTLAAESQHGAKTVVLKVDLGDIDVVRLIALARVLGKSGRTDPFLSY